MAERKPEIAKAMQSPWFRETLCDLFNTTQRIERQLLKQKPSAKISVLAQCPNALVLDISSQEPQTLKTFAPLANELVGFTSKTGIPLLINPQP